MKIGKSRNLGKAGNPTKNQSKKSFYIIITIIITALLITWVYMMGRKAEETVTVLMTSQSIYKNQVITNDMLIDYEMLKGEFEKYHVVSADGTSKTRRILLASERNLVVNTFAAYPLQANTLCESKAFIKSRIDNSDNVLYSFPGKEIVPLEVGSAELRAFKTFLQPGDRVNITAIYSQSEPVEYLDEDGEIVREQIEVFKTEEAFKDIMIADLLNNSGDSILDIYADYRDRTVYQQAQLDSSQTFKDSVEPKTLLVAFTPEELTRYYFYLSKAQVSFKMSLPQRVE